MANKDRREYLISFLRGCAHGADEGHLGVDQFRLLVNGDLMREAADAFEEILPKEESFEDTTDELCFNLVRAEQHSRQAHDLLYMGDGPKRSVWYKVALGRAQSILMSLYMQELRRDRRREDEQRSEEHGSDLQGKEESRPDLPMEGRG